MTLLPQLERELVEAAARHYAPRRSPVSRLPVRKLAAVGAIAGLVALVSVAISNWPGSPETEQHPAQVRPNDASAQGSLRELYDVFRRPRAAADSVPPLDERVTRAIERPGVALQLQGSRLLANDGGYAYYAVPAIARNEPQLCILNVDRHSDRAGGGCGSLDALTRSDRPFLSTTTRPGGRQEAFLLVRDGVDRVDLELRDGRRVSASVVSNAVLVTVKPGVSSIQWNDEAGQNHQWSLHDDPADSTD